MGATLNLLQQRPAVDGAKVEANHSAREIMNFAKGRQSDFGVIFNVFLAIPAP
jgi:hypothetical protein